MVRIIAETAVALEQAVEAPMVVHPVMAVLVTTVGPADILDQTMRPVERKATDQAQHQGEQVQHIIHQEWLLAETQHHLERMAKQLWFSI